MRVFKLGKSELLMFGMKFGFFHFEVFGFNSPNKYIGLQNTELHFNGGLIHALSDRVRDALISCGSIRHIYMDQLWVRYRFCTCMFVCRG